MEVLSAPFGNLLLCLLLKICFPPLACYIFDTFILSKLKACYHLFSKPHITLCLPDAMITCMCHHTELFIIYPFLYNASFMGDTVVIKFFVTWIIKVRRIENSLQRTEEHYERKADDIWNVSLSFKESISNLISLASRSWLILGNVKEWTFISYSSGDQQGRGAATQPGICLLAVFHNGRQWQHVWCRSRGQGKEEVKSSLFQEPKPSPVRKASICLQGQSPDNLTNFLKLSPVNMIVSVSRSQQRTLCKCTQAIEAKHHKQVSPP